MTTIQIIWAVVATTNMLNLAAAIYDKDARRAMAWFCAVCPALLLALGF